MALLTQGLNNWKLRLVLSALLCIIGLATMISMILGLFIELSVFDKSIVSTAIFIVGVPTYLIISGLAQIDEYTIVEFLNEHVEEFSAKAEVLIKDDQELGAEEKRIRKELTELFNETPLYKFLPDKPVKQAYLLMLASLLISYAIWFLN